MSGPHPANDEVLAIWRIGLVAYRKARSRAKTPVNNCHPAGVAAMRAAFPELTEQDARRHLIDAIAWANIQHREWLDRAEPKMEWIWPPDHRGAGYHRNPGYEDE